MKILTSLLLLIGIIGVGILGYLGLTAYQLQIRNEAIDACYHVATVSFFERDSTGNVLRSSEIPATDFFTQCIEHKGYTL